MQTWVVSLYLPLLIVEGRVPCLIFWNKRVRARRRKRRSKRKCLRQKRKEEVEGL
jgi:hypothetical protein